MKKNSTSIFIAVIYFMLGFMLAVTINVFYQSRYPYLVIDRETVKKADREELHVVSWEMEPIAWFEDSLGCKDVTHWCYINPETVSIWTVYPPWANRRYVRPWGMMPAMWWDTVQQDTVTHMQVDTINFDDWVILTERMELKEGSGALFHIPIGGIYCDSIK